MTCSRRAAGWRPADGHRDALLPLDRHATTIYERSYSFLDDGSAVPFRTYPWRARSGRRSGCHPRLISGRLRIRRAVQQLRDGVPAARVAADCGFADQAHLTRHFKRLVGVTPGVFAST